MTDYERVTGEVRGRREFDFALEIRGCPRCGSRDIGDPKTTWGLRDDEIWGPDRSVGYCDVTCPKCGLQREFLYLRMKPSPDHVKEIDPVTGAMTNKSDFRHLGGLEASQIIGPHEFAVELAYCADHVINDPALVEHPDPLRFQDDATWKSFDDHLFQNAEKCTRELRKFIPEGADEVPADFFRNDDARRVRTEHPEWFRRAYIDEREATWERLGTAIDAEGARREPSRTPEEKREAKAEIDAFVEAARAKIGLGRRHTSSGPISAAMLEAHDRWLDDKGGARLHVTGVDASGAKLSALDLTAAIFEDTTLDRADVSFTRLHAAALTNVRAPGAGFASAMLAGTTLVGCDFTAAGMPIANLGDATISECDFSGADLERTTWYRSKLTRCTFAGAQLTDAGLDKAIFTDCDLRGADLGIVKVGLLGTAMDATFIRCDLRETNWQGRDLFRVKFVDCKLADAHGTPRLEETVIERPDLSPLGDASQIGTARDVIVQWGIDPDAPPPSPPAPTHRRLVYDVTDDEGDYLEQFLQTKGFQVTKRLFRSGTELRFELQLHEPIAAPIAPLIEQQLAKYRYAQERRKQHPEDYENPDGTPKMVPQLIAEAVINEGLDRGDSFEHIVDRLVSRVGLTREHALEAMIDPSKIGSHR